MKNCYTWKWGKLAHEIPEDFVPDFRLEDVGLLAAPINLTGPCDYQTSADTSYSKNNLMQG